jgi:hypothetical protein
MHMNTNNMSGYLTSNYIKGEDLDADLWIEAIICSVTERAFGEDGERDIKPLIRIEDGRGRVLNQTRLKALIAAYGPNADNWLNKQILIKRGMTHFQGKPTPCVDIQPVIPNRLEGGPATAKIEGPKSGPSGAAAKPVETASPPRGGQGRGKITSGRPKSALEPQPLLEELNDGLNDLPFDK